MTAYAGWPARLQAGHPRRSDGFSGYVPIRRVGRLGKRVGCGEELLRLASRRNTTVIPAADRADQDFIAWREPWYLRRPSLEAARPHHYESTHRASIFRRGQA